MEKDHNWKPANSLWAIFTILGIFNWILFIYAGFNSKCRKYIIIGILYSIISFSFFLVSGIGLDSLGAFIFLLCTIGYFFGIVYSFLNLRPYWERLDLISELSKSDLENKKIWSMNNLELKKIINDNENNNGFSSYERKTRVIITDNISINSKTPLSSEVKKQKNTNYVKTKDKDKKISVNSASKEELLTIPEINPELAEKIIYERKLTNGFKNMEEFEERLALKPHISIELESKIIFNNIENIYKDTSNNNGRIVDF